MTNMQDTSHKADLERMLKEIYENNGIAAEGEFKGLVVLIEDFKLERDIEALTSAHRLLQRIYARQVNLSDEMEHHTYCRGRVSQMIDELAWVLQRFAAEQPALDVAWQSRAGELLLGIVRLQPTASFHGLARRMLDSFELVEQALAALEEEELVTKRQVEGSTYYFLTKRGWLSFMKMELSRFEELTPDRA